MDDITKKRAKLKKKPLQYKPEVDPVMIAALRIMPHLDILSKNDMFRVFSYLSNKYLAVELSLQEVEEEEGEDEC